MATNDHGESWSRRLAVLGPSRATQPLVNQLATTGLMYTSTLLAKQGDGMQFYPMPRVCTAHTLPTLPSSVEQWQERTAAGLKTMFTSDHGAWRMCIVHRNTLLAMNSGSNPWAWGKTASYPSAWQAGKVDLMPLVARQLLLSDWVARQGLKTAG